MPSQIQVYRININSQERLIVCTSGGGLILQALRSHFSWFFDPPIQFTTHH